MASEPPGTFSGQDMAMHKALYDISLLSKRSGSQIVNVDGQMYYEWSRGCDAWETKHRFNLLYEYTDSPSMRITSDFSTFETFDGKELSFSSRRMRDGELFEEVRGSAHTNTEEAEARYTLPEKITYKLPENTYFPMGHTISVVQKINEGKKIYNANIFDGSDEDGPRQVNAFIGEKTTAPKNALESKDIDQTLLQPHAHNIRLAFFLMDQEEPESDYEMNLVFHENGIISAMDIDYKDFSIRQKLVALEPVDSTCGEDADNRAQD